MTEESILKLAEDVSKPLGLQVVEARFTQSGKKRVLEVTIHRPGGRVALDDCEAVSRELDKVLDETTPAVIEGAYVLEVTSPGLERKLKTDREFQIFLGSSVRLQTKEKIGALGVAFDGILENKLGNQVVIAKPRPVQTGKANKKNMEEELPETVTIEMVKISDIRLQPSGAEIVQEAHLQPLDLSDNQITTTE